MTALIERQATAGETESDREQAVARPPSPWRNLALTVAAIACAVFASERAAEMLVAGAAQDTPRPTQRHANIEIVSKNPVNLPRATAGHRSLFLFGNSHTYALPGLKAGEPLRGDPGATLIDELARELEAANPQRSSTVFYRIANPNLLPFEMLTRTGYLLERGFVPDVAVMSFTWRNVARDSGLRHDIHRVYAEGDFVRAWRAALASPEVAASPRLLAAIDTEVRQAEAEDRESQLRSSADRLDATLKDRLGDHVALVGQSAELRARIFRSLEQGIDQLFHKQTDKASYDVIDEDLAFNLDCLRALVGVLRAHHVTPVFYLAPERSDLPPIIATDREQPIVDEFKTFAEAHGAVLIDARHVVPNEYWGFERDTPDRSHFTEPGHSMLAKFIAGHPETQAAWAALDKAP